MARTKKKVINKDQRKPYTPKEIMKRVGIMKAINKEMNSLVSEGISHVIPHLSQSLVPFLISLLLIEIGNVFFLQFGHKNTSNFTLFSLVLSGPGKVSSQYHGEIEQRKT